MKTNRRIFLKKAAITAVAPVAVTSCSAPKISETGSPVLQEGLSEARTLKDGWLNVRDCGASGSQFRTTASAVAGSKQITVTEVGDFRVGQGIMVSKCNIRCAPKNLWGTGVMYQNRKPLNNSVEVRGFDGSAGSWLFYLLDIAPSSTPSFRWSDNFGRTWHPEVQITHDWQPLAGGLEVKLNQRDWESGYLIAIEARDQLISRIVKIEGNVLTLQDEANRTVNDAVARHNDTVALQEAMDRAVKEKLNVFVPVGYYMLGESVRINNPAAITIEGSSSVDTILDISEGEGACFTLIGGTEATIRNFRMFGFMGFNDRDMAGSLRTYGAPGGGVWGFLMKHSNGVTIRDTERVLVENCHASKMSGECFVAAGRSRGTAKPGESWTQWITYRRCSVTDSARNAFNDVVCGVENTSILNCRIVDVGGCAWESASRFVKFIGNYIRNAGTVAIGNLGLSNREANSVTPENKDKMYPQVGSGQHIIADNVFESIVPYGGCAIRSTRGATQAIFRNNLFINFNSNAIEVVGTNINFEYLSANTTITGNIFDMTCIGQKPAARTAIAISCNDTIISDNQIYVRGKSDPLVTAIRLNEPALNLNVHDNLIRNCGSGLVTGIGEARVGDVIDDKTFIRATGPAGLPIERLDPEMVKGWTIIWRSDPGLQKFEGMSVVESFDPETTQFILREPYPMKKGDRMEIISPSVNWTIHNNTITDCITPVKLDSYGSKTSIFRNNMVTRGNTENVPCGIEVHGCFRLLGNRIVDFNEEKSTAIALYPDALGRPCSGHYQGNIIENCSGVVLENKPSLWKKSLVKDNITIGCIKKLPE